MRYAALNMKSDAALKQPHLIAFLKTDTPHICSIAQLPERFPILLLRV